MPVASTFASGSSSPRLQHSRCLLLGSRGWDFCFALVFVHSHAWQAQPEEEVGVVSGWEGVPLWSQDS